MHEGGCICGAVRYRVSVAGGSFDDPSWLRIERHTGMRSKQPWVPVPPGMEKHEKAAIN